MTGTRIQNLQMGLLLLLFALACQSRPSTVSPELRKRAVQELQQGMEKQEQWVKVHAAEYKLWLDYTDGVLETFLLEEKKWDQLSSYRIGVWRVLAQADPASRDSYIQKILRAFEDRNGPDRVHAAESLAKLGESLADLSPELTREVVEGPVNSLYVYTLWSTLQGSDTAAAREQLLDLALNPERDEIIRLQAAFVLRSEGVFSTASWKKLARAGLQEPKASLPRVYLLSAALMHAPEEERNSTILGEVKNALRGLKEAPSKGVRMEIAHALGTAGSPEDLPVLVALFENENPLMPEEEVPGEDLQAGANADVRAAAAYGILMLDRRQEYSLAWADWFVVAAYLAGMVGVGYYFSQKNKSERDYYLGGGKMNPVAVGLSLFATLLSSLSYLSYPGEMVKYGPVIFSGVLVFPLVYYVVGWFLIPRFMKLRVTSAYEILEINLGVSIRVLATFFFLSLRFLWMGTIIFITVHTAILAIFGVDPSHTLIISILLMGITIFYTTLGGLKAVVFTDVIQSGVLMGGAILTLLVVTLSFGSVAAWFPTEWPAHWGELQLGVDARQRLTIGNALLTTFVWYLASSGSDQMSIQRFLATENARTARKTFGVSLLTTFVVQILLGLVGLAVLAYFTAFPHFLAPGETVTTSADQLFPKFIRVGLPVGISGLVAAGILAAAMSSLSSGLNSTSSVISEDLIKRFTRKSRAPQKQMAAVRNLSLFVGVFALLLSLLISKVEGNLYEVIVKVVNLFVSPLFVLFFLALFVPFATGRATFLAGLGSVAIAVAIAFFKFLGIEVLFILPVSLGVGVLLGTILSFLDVRLLGNTETMEKRSREAAIFKGFGESDKSARADTGKRTGM